MNRERTISKRRIRTSRISAVADLIEQRLSNLGGTSPLSLIYSYFAEYGQPAISTALDILEARQRLIYLADSNRVHVSLAPHEDDLGEARDQLRDAADDLRDWSKMLAGPAMTLAEPHMRQLKAEMFKRRLLEAAELAEDLLRPPEVEDESETSAD